MRTVYQSVVDSIWDHAVEDGKVVAEDTETTQRRVVEVYRQHLMDMEQKKVDVEEFTYSRGMTSAPEKYKNKNTPHVQVRFTLPILVGDKVLCDRKYTTLPMELATFPPLQISNCDQTI